MMFIKHHKEDKFPTFFASPKKVGKEKRPQAFLFPTLIANFWNELFKLACVASSNTKSRSQKFTQPLRRNAGEICSLQAVSSNENFANRKDGSGSLLSGL
ncbi:hypothetical protein [Frederiksenia canicola]|uniref:Uncharacterized protein n=1 Tax=Frederiksenia canicola TaxID=123824 RepID=A0AAE7C1F7_9PAST|nr:hypothetical protein [Frederiksenia canicola]QIM64276.1 hypothetical protein A4G17_01805 [Frederiksenia canicola]